MNSTTARFQWLARSVITSSIGLITLVIIAGSVAYPLVLAQDGAAIYLGLYAITAIGYLVVAWRYGRPRSPEAARALQPGIIWGGVLSGLWLIEIISGNFGIGSILYFPATWAAFTLPLLAGWLGARQTGRIRTGTLVGLWSGLISGACACLTLAIIGFFFNATIQHDPQTIHEFARSGTSDINTYIFGDFLAGGINHLWLVGPAWGSLAGTLGGVVGAQFARPIILFIIDG